MIVVTGGSGYVGSHIINKILESGYQVRVMVHNRSRAEKEGRLSGLPVELVEGDVTKPETLDRSFQGAQVIIHTVAIAIEKGNNTYDQVNAEGTKNALEAAKRSGVERFINMSQLGAASDLPYRFLASKGKAQEYVRKSRLKWTAFRPSVIWGPEDEFANTFAKLIPLTPIIFPIVDKQARFEPVWVNDVASSVVKAINDPETIGKEFEIGGPEVLTMEEIERRTLMAVGAKRILVPFPKQILRVIVKLMESTLPSPPVTLSLLELLAVDNVTKDNRIRQFVEKPRAFTPQNTAEYMREVTVRDTLRQFFGK
jgi:uncharacterized protein YbjT (DUF2867 family)